jgi:uncharacterized protein (TIGR02217 family)
MEILDLGVDYGTIATLVAKTTIIAKGNGLEQRNSDWNQCLLRFQIGERTLTNDEIAYLQDFHIARKGKLEAFLFKDWSDYQFNNQIGTSNGTIVEFPLLKSYSVGTTTAKRFIRWPKASTIRVFRVAGSPEVTTELTTGWSVVNGVVVFSTAPAAGKIIAQGEFFVPVRFEQDGINFKFQAVDRFSDQKLFSLESLTLAEIRDDNPLSPDSLPSTLKHTFDLGFDLETMGGRSFNTQVTILDSGFESRKQNWTSPKGTWEIGSRSLLRKELDYFISLFRVSRGRCGSFYYLDYGSSNTYRVRFAEDAISFRFDAYESNSQEVIFNLSGVGITRAGPKIDATTYIIPLVDTSGSMDGVQSLVTEAIQDLRPILKDAIYEGSQTAVDKYTKAAIGFSSERYLDALAADYRDNISEPKKYLFLIFENEAAEPDGGLRYHTLPRNPNLEPSENYQEDFDTFLEAWGSAISFNCLFVIPTKDVPTFETDFREHLSAAINGFDGYTPLKRFGIVGKFSSPLTATAADYFAMISRFIDF